MRMCIIVCLQAGRDRCAETYRQFHQRFSYEFFAKAKK